MLSFHKGFNIMNLFKELDEDDKGYVAPDDL